MYPRFTVFVRGTEHRSARWGAAGKERICKRRQHDGDLRPHPPSGPVRVNTSVRRDRMALHVGATSTEVGRQPTLGVAVLMDQHSARQPKGNLPKESCSDVGGLNRTFRSTVIHVPRFTVQISSSGFPSRTPSSNSVGSSGPISENDGCVGHLNGSGGVLT